MSSDRSSNSTNWSSDWLIDHLPVLLSGSFFHQPITRFMTSHALDGPGKPRPPWNRPNQPDPNRNHPIEQFGSKSHLETTPTSRREARQAPRSVRLRLPPARYPPGAHRAATPAGRVSADVLACRPAEHRHHIEPYRSAKQPPPTIRIPPTSAAKATARIAGGTGPTADRSIARCRPVPRAARNCSTCFADHDALAKVWACDPSMRIEEPTDAAS